MKRLRSYNQLAFMGRDDPYSTNSPPVHKVEFARKGNSRIHEIWYHTTSNTANIAISEPDSRDYFNSNQILLHEARTAHSKRRVSLESASRFAMKRAKLENLEGEEFLCREGAIDGCNSKEMWDSTRASTNTARSLSDKALKMCQACKVWLPAESHLLAIAERNQVFAAQTELGTKTARNLKPLGFSMIGTGWEMCMQCSGIRLHSYATSNNVQLTPSMSSNTFGETKMNFMSRRNINISRENRVKANSRTSRTGSQGFVRASNTLQWGDEINEVGKRCFAYRSTDSLRSRMIFSSRTRSTDMAFFPVPRDFTLSTSTARVVKSRSVGSYALPEGKAVPDVHRRREHVPTSCSTHLRSHHPDVSYVAMSGLHLEATDTASAQAERRLTSTGEAEVRKFGTRKEVQRKRETIISASSRGSQLYDTMNLLDNSSSPGSYQHPLPRLSTDLRKLKAHHVRTYLESTDCRQYAKFFEEQDIDGAVVSILSMVELAHLLNIKLGPAIRLHKHLREMASSVQ